jgi:glucuronokinase
MDFGAGEVESLPAGALPPLFVAYRDGIGVPSGGVHATLRRRFAAGDPHVVDAMRRLAELTAEARRALTAGDAEAFAARVGASFDLRAAMVDVDPQEAEGIAIARAHGLHANYAGSGGSVVGVLGDADPSPLATVYRRAGWRLLAPADAR